MYVALQRDHKRSAVMLCFYTKRAFDLSAELCQRKCQLLMFNSAANQTAGLANVKSFAASGSKLPCLLRIYHFINAEN